MKVINEVIISLVMDRGVMKRRVNVVRKGRIMGFLKPVEDF